MKRCPDCRRDYYDDSLHYCLDDGTALLEGPGSMDAPATAIQHETAPSNEAATRAQVHTTEQTAVLPSSSVDASRSRTFDKRYVIALTVGVLALSAYFGYRNFYSSNSGQIKSIAVLPFENRSTNADTEYLSDGLSDSLIYRLTQLPNLRVSPTSSVIRYKGKQTDVGEIGRELEVDAVMSGKLAQRGADLTISVELNPKYATAYQQFGVECLTAMGRFDEAVAAGKRAEELDPVSPIIGADLGHILTRARRYDEAIVQLNRVLTHDPNFWVTYWYLGMAHRGKAQYAEAVAAYRKALALSDNPWPRALLIHSLVRAGERVEAVRLLSELQAEAARRYVSSSALAIAYGAVGEKDKAFALLEKDIAELASRPSVFSVNPVWDDLRDEPRFAEMVRRVEGAKMD